MLRGASGSSSFAGWDFFYGDGILVSWQSLLIAGVLHAPSSLARTWIMLRTAL